MAHPPPLPAAPALTTLADFGDWLSPMIVKELRQGMRTWVFVGAFISLQAVLVMLLLISSASHNQEAPGAVFWTLVAFILGFILPLRGINALAGEAKAQTLDLLTLTRLSCFRIAVGKWAALVAQSSLITISVLPFVTLRYFGGGIDLLAELRFLLLLWMLSAGATALAVAVSALSSIILRALALMGLWIGSGLACTYFFQIVFKQQASLSFGYGVEVQWWEFFAVVTPLWAYVCYFALDFGASVIAPQAANHATRKRLISLAFLLAACAPALIAPDEGWKNLGRWCAFWIWTLASFDCLTETPTFAVSVYEPFAKRNVFGRAMVWLLAPGWASGLLYFLMMSAIWLFVLTGSEISDFRFWQSVCVIGSALTPLALAVLFALRSPRLLVPYVSCGFAIGVFSCLLLVMRDVSDFEKLGYVACISPPTALTMGFFRYFSEETEILIYGAFSGLIYLGYLLVRAIPVWRGMNKAMQEARARRANADASTLSSEAPGA